MQRHWTETGTTKSDAGTNAGANFLRKLGHIPSSPRDIYPTSVVCDVIGRRPAPLVRRGFSARFSPGPNYLCNRGCILSSPRDTYLRSVVCDVIERRPALFRFRPIGFREDRFALPQLIKA